MDENAFAGAVLAWHARHGRKDLPWQRDPTPYRVWVSEVMLQQTQVGVVVGYFERFTGRFPDVPALAAGPLDDVLHLWSGLGYYSRARNLHRAAVLATERHGGELPRDHAALQALPGIGRSTASAILALAHGDRHAILDGNVKRVLARYHAVPGWPGRGAVSRALWELAERHTPGTDVATYTQAMMDLGATLCTRSRPRCVQCPVRAGCVAHLEGRERDFPSPKPRVERPSRSTVLVIARDRAGRVLLERRPPAGVWGGLWSFPECPPERDVPSWCAEALDLAVQATRPLATVRHGFTHFELEMRPVLVEALEAPRVGEQGGRAWFDPGEPPPVGLPAPIGRLLTEIGRAS